MSPNKQAVKCSKCNSVLDVDAAWIGRRARCKNCKHEFQLEAQSILMRPSDTSIESGPDDTLVSPEHAKLIAEKKETIVNSKLGTFARFELLELLGEGAFGKVYKAFDSNLDRVVAVKVPTFSTTDSKKMSRFLEEAKAAAALRHPNIVPIYEAGQFEGRPYIVSEYIEGCTLSKRIEDFGITYKMTATWIRDLALALAYAHEKGIVHRDVKSENIMLDKNQVPYLMDFGLAKRLTEDSSRTMDGTVMGTPAYMPPEQAKGEQKNIGPKSDQYSLGVVLYELLCRRRPFSGTTHSVIAQVISSEPKSPKSIAKSVPAPLEAICQKAMSKSLNERYSSAGGFAADLDRFLQGRLPTACNGRWILNAKRLFKRNQANIATLGVFTLLALFSTIALWNSKSVSPNKEIAQTTKSGVNDGLQATTKQVAPSDAKNTFPANDKNASANDVFNLNSSDAAPVPITNDQIQSMLALLESKEEELPSRVEPISTIANSVASSVKSNRDTTQPKYVELAEAIRIDKSNSAKQVVLTTSINVKEMVKHSISVWMRIIPNGSATKAELPFAFIVNKVTDAGALSQMKVAKFENGWRQLQVEIVPKSIGRQLLAIQVSDSSELLITDLSCVSEAGLDVVEVKNSDKPTSGWQVKGRAFSRDQIPKRSWAMNQLNLLARTFNAQVIDSEQGTKCLLRNATLTSKFSDLLDSINDLDVLELRDCQFTQSVRPIPVLRQPKLLQFYQCKLIPSDFFHNLKDALSIGRIDCFQTEVDDQQFNEFTRANVSSISVQNSLALTEKGLSVIDQAKELRELDLQWSSSVTDNVLAMIGKLESLEVLRTSSTQPVCTRQGMLNIRNLKKLRELVLWGVPVDAEFFRMISKFKKLEHLDVSHPLIDPIALQELTNSNSLRTLILNNSPQLNLLNLGFLQKMPGLSTVEMQLSGLSPDDQQQIRKNNPNVNFVFGKQTTTRELDARKVEKSPIAVSPQSDGDTKSIGKSTLPIAITPKGTLPDTFTNSIGMEFVKVPKGAGWLGGGAGQTSSQKVEIKQDFYLGKYEVTQAEWEAVTGLAPSGFSRNGNCADDVKDISDQDLKRFPAEMLSWDDCQVFIERLNKIEKSEGWEYRMPKEAEWEYACRGGPGNKRDSAFDFYFSKPTNMLLPDQANFGSPGALKRTTKVGSYEPNALGLYDMTGNVWEWCDDGEKTAEGATHRVLRGGCWGDVAAFCRAAYRFPYDPSGRANGSGFRVALIRSTVSDSRTRGKDN